MQLRPLTTDEEKDMIRQAKKRANVYLKPQRDKARRKLKAASSERERRHYESELEELKPITGTPVRVYHVDTFESLFVDYDNLQKLLRGLDERKWCVSVWIDDDERPELHISYKRYNDPGSHGQVTLWGLSKVYDDVLRSVQLPAIAI